MREERAKRDKKWKNGESRERRRERDRWKRLGGTIALGVERGTGTNEGRKEGRRHGDK